MKILFSTINSCSVKPARLTFQNKLGETPSVDPSKLAGKIPQKMFEKASSGITDDMKKAFTETFKAFSSILRTVSGGMTDSIKFIKDIVHKDPVHLPEVERIKSGLTTEAQIKQDRIRYYTELSQAYNEKLKEFDVFYKPFSKAYDKLVEEDRMNTARVRRVDAIIDITKKLIANTEEGFISTQRAIEILEYVKDLNKASVTQFTAGVSQNAYHYKKAKDEYMQAKTDLNPSKMRLCKIKMDSSLARKKLAETSLSDAETKVGEATTKIDELRAKIVEPNSGKTIQELQYDMEDQKTMKSDIESKMRSFGDTDMKSLIELLEKEHKISPEEAKFFKESSLPLKDFIKSMKSDFIAPLEESMDDIRANIKACDYKLDAL